MNGGGQGRHDHRRLQHPRSAGAEILAIRKSRSLSRRRDIGRSRVTYQALLRQRDGDVGSHRSLMTTISRPSLDLG